MPSFCSRKEIWVRSRTESTPTSWCSTATTSPFRRTKSRTSSRCSPWSGARSCSKRRNERFQEKSMDVIMPQLGETVAEGTVTRWHKKIGDAVKADEALFDVETDKVSTEI